MMILGSIFLVGGLGGLIAYMTLLTFYPRRFSRTASTVVMIALFSIAGAGLIIVTLATGGRSLHTGG